MFSGMNNPTPQNNFSDFNSAGLNKPPAPAPVKPKPAFLPPPTKQSNTQNNNSMMGGGFNMGGGNNVSNNNDMFSGMNMNSGTQNQT